MTIKEQPVDQLVVVQISDPHMGPLLETQVLGNVSGTEGHDPVLCRLLVGRMRFIAADYGTTESELRWIVGGDLTRVGDANEFAVVADFMQTVPPRDIHGRALRPTLGVPRDRYEDVPGNHDHFDGWDPESLAHAALNPPPAWTASIFPSRFKATCWDNLAAPWLSKAGSIQLELFGVDSNSGLANQKANRFAEGEISDGEFAQLEDALELSSQQKEVDGVARVRAIICHHAFSKLPQDGFWKAAPLRLQSVKRLWEIAATYRVAAIFTGHTHRHHFWPFTTVAVRYGEDALRRCHLCELRCPTTLQVPAGPRTGFFVHHLFRESPGGPVVWRPRLYMLAAQRLHAQGITVFPDLVLP